jgi:hypothetical protein
MCVCVCVCIYIYIPTPYMPTVFTGMAMSTSSPLIISSLWPIASCYAPYCQAIVNEKWMTLNTPHELIGIPYSGRGQPSHEISAPARIFSKPARK